MLDKYKFPNEDYNRGLQGKRLLDFLDDVEAFEIFSSKEKIKDFLNNIGPEEFIDFITKINNILRNKKISSVTIDGGDVVLTGIVEQKNFPKSEDKKRLIVDLLEGVKTMDDLNEIAAVIGATITGVHLFKDGNGRTSRILYKLISEGYNESDESKKGLKDVMSFGGRNVVDLNIHSVEDEINKTIASDYASDFRKNRCIKSAQSIRGEIEYNPDIEKEKQRLTDYLIDTDSLYMFYAIYNFLSEIGELEKFLQKFFKENGDLSRSRIDTKKLFSEISPKELEKILDKYYELKTEFVKRFIEAMTNNPEKYLDDSGKTIKDKFFERAKIN